MLLGVFINSSVTESVCQWKVFVNARDTFDTRAEKDRLSSLCDSLALNMLMQCFFPQNTDRPQKAEFVQFHTAMSKLKTAGFTHLWFFGFGFDWLVALFQVLVVGETNNSPKLLTV